MQKTGAHAYYGDFHVADIRRFGWDCEMPYYVVLDEKGVLTPYVDIASSMNVRGGPIASHALLGDVANDKISVYYIGGGHKSVIAIKSPNLDGDEILNFLPTKMKSFGYRATRTELRLLNFVNNPNNINDDGKRILGQFRITFCDFSLHVERCSSRFVHFSNKDEKEKVLCVARMLQCWRCFRNVWSFVEETPDLALEYLELLQKKSAPYTQPAESKAQPRKRIPLIEEEVLQNGFVEPNVVDLAVEIEGFCALSLEQLLRLVRFGRTMQQADERIAPVRLQHEDEVVEQLDLVEKSVVEVANNFNDLADLQEIVPNEQIEEDKDVCGQEVEEEVPQLVEGENGQEEEENEEGEKENEEGEENRSKKKEEEANSTAKTSDSSISSGSNTTANTPGSANSMQYSNENETPIGDSSGTLSENSTATESAYSPNKGSQPKKQQRAAVDALGSPSIAPPSPKRVRFASVNEVNGVEPTPPNGEMSEPVVIEIKIENQLNVADGNLEMEEEDRDIVEMLPPKREESLRVPDEIQVNVIDQLNVAEANLNDETVQCRVCDGYFNKNWMTEIPTDPNVLRKWIGVLGSEFFGKIIQNSPPYFICMNHLRFIVDKVFEEEQPTAEL